MANFALFSANAFHRKTNRFAHKNGNWAILRPQTTQFANLLRKNVFKLCTEFNLYDIIYKNNRRGKVMAEIHGNYSEEQIQVLDPKISQPNYL